MGEGMSRAESDRNYWRPDTASSQTALHSPFIAKKGKPWPRDGKGLSKVTQGVKCNLELEPTSSDSLWQFVPLHQGRKLCIFRRQVVMNNMENGQIWIVGRGRGDLRKPESVWSG